MAGTAEVDRRDARTAAVMVAYRGGDRLLDSVERLLALSPPDLDLFLVVSPPTDDAARRLLASASERGRLSVRQLEANRGFAAAANSAVEWAAASGKEEGIRYWAYAFVNQDCLVEPAWAPPMFNLLAEQPGVGLVGAHILELDGRTVQHAGGRVRPNGLTEHIGRGQSDSAFAGAVPCDVDYVTGALCALRAETWDLLGPFDPGFAPVYFEEVDLCMRMRRAGLRVVYLPASRARHAEASSSDGPGSELFLERYHSSRMRFVARHLLGPRALLRTLTAELSWLARLRTLRELGPVLRAYRALPRQVLALRRAGRPASP